MCCHIQDKKAYQDRAKSFSDCGSDFVCLILSVPLVSIYQEPFRRALLLYMEGAGHQCVWHIDGRSNRYQGICGKDCRLRESGQATRPAPSIYCPSVFLLIIVFRTLYQFIKYHGDGAQNNNGSNHHVQLEHLGTVDNQISQPPSRGKKFPDNNTHKGKTDIDFHAA